MSKHNEFVPLWVIDAGDDDRDVEVEFEWTPGTPTFIPPLNRPEDFDPGSGDEFIIRSAHAVLGNGTRVPTPYTEVEEGRIIDWLDGEWVRPDYEAEKADYLRDLREDERMEARR